MYIQFKLPSGFVCTDTIIRIPDNANIPFDPANTDYQRFKKEVLEGKKDASDKTKEDIEDIDLKYDQNNLKIFAPKTKDQCIRLKNGRGWCTSREGSGNMYYNYRLGHERTLYYVIDEDKKYDDLNFDYVRCLNYILLLLVSLEFSPSILLVNRKL
jgi:hypothetical protein